MKFIYFFIFLSFTSCSVIKIFSDQEINILEKCTTIGFDMGMPLLNVKLDSVQHRFLFDTGATGSVVVDSSEIKDFQNKNFFYFGSSVGADKKTSKRRLFTANINSETFEGKNKVFAFFNLPVQECQKEQKFSGIIGMDVLLDQKLTMFLNFTQNQLCNISKESQNKFLKEENFQRIKSECSRRMIYIFITIENVEYKFKLDTGFTGDLIIPRSKIQNFKNQNFRAFEGSLFSTLTTITTGNELIFNEMPVKFGVQAFQSPVIISSTIAAQNAGINFIKKFDWIIDYEKNQVYIKPNMNIEIPISKKERQYATIMYKGNLVIKLKEISQTKYNLGDKIVSVNNQKVTPENICELQDFLNKTEDWNTLDLEVIHK
ncbi:aspartyl protease [Flavobacterium noncentrifugens]|uniref:Aspartyl protease n=2 Tax=Flavobacterium noncentrifugens TaxID=1128970 RepID=A0A1G8STN0_9FLAO|nr:aspartyl protease [Flavobacterium noncentrifugens]